MAISDKTNLIYQLQDVLSAVMISASTDFSGIGLIICDAPATLPIIPIQLELCEQLPDADIVSQLSTIWLHFMDQH